MNVILEEKVPVKLRPCFFGAILIALKKARWKKFTSQHLKNSMKNQTMCESIWPTRQVLEIKKENRKRKKRPPAHPKPHRRRDTLSQRKRNVRNHSCVPFNQEDVLKNPEKSQKQTIVHPENSGNFMKEQNVLVLLLYFVNYVILSIM